MATLPPSTDITGSGVTQGGAKTFFSTMRTFIADLLGTDSADKAAARAAFGVSGQLQEATRFTVGGTSNAMTGTLNPAIVAYVSGLRVTTTPSGANAITAPTINLNSLGIKTIKKRDGSGTKVALAPGDYNASGPFDFEYDGTDFILLNQVSFPSAGFLSDFAGTSAPIGYLACPVSLTYINATTYSALAFAIGVTWGNGGATVTAGAFVTGHTYVIKTVGTTDFTLIGATSNTVGRTFVATGAGTGTGTANSEIALPWFAADYAAIQANGNVGTSSVGSVISHHHSYAYVGSAGGIAAPTGPLTNFGAFSTGDTGGSANLAAGVRVLRCIKY